MGVCSGHLKPRKTRALQLGSLCGGCKCPSVTKSGMLLNASSNTLPLS